MNEPSYRLPHPPHGSSEPLPRAKPLRPESLIIKAPVDLLEWVDERREAEDIRPNTDIVLNICKQPHPPWGSDWGPWLREKYYR